MQNAVIPWLDGLEEASDGRVEVERYWSQTLAKMPDHWNAAKFGLADIAMAFHGVWPGMTPLADATALPFMPGTTGVQQSSVLYELFEKFPEMKQSFEKDNKILNIWGNFYDSIGTTKKTGPVKTLEDLKGLVIRAPGGPASEMINNLGGSAKYIGASDLYLALQKGVLDGLVMAPAFAGNLRIDEVISYYAYPPIAIVGNYFTHPMNWNTWNKIPDDIKAAWEKEGLLGLQACQDMGYGWADKYEEGMVAELKAKGSEYIRYDVPQAEFDRWLELGGSPVWDKWVASMEALGLPGREVLEEALLLYPKYKK